VAKAKPLQGNFSAGVLSPQAMGRVDIARYPNAAKRLRNIICRTLGGAQKRFGTQYIAATKNSANQSRLIPYIISKDVGYMLEMGTNYMRVFKPDGTQVAGPYEIVTPYTLAQVLDMDFSQGEDAMFIFHNAVYPNRLRHFADNSWDCNAAPFTTTPFAEIGDNYAVALTLSTNTVGTGRTMTAGSAVFLASDVGRAITWNAGLAIITGYTDTQHVTVQVVIIFDSTAIPSGLWNLDSSPQTTNTPSAASPVGVIITMTLTNVGWRATDVGKFVRINAGLVKITLFTSTTIVSGTIIRELTSATASPALAWTLEASVWNAINGYPRTGTFYQQRLFAAGSIKNPQTVWGSKTGEPLEFIIGIKDDDGFSFTLAGDDNQVNQINYLVASRNILALTFGGEFSMNGGVEKAITPTNIQVTPQTPHGSSTVRPVQVRKETLFPQRAGRKLRAMGYTYVDDGYKSPDITTLAEHITESGIACMAFQQEPEPIVWIALNNGRLVSVTLDRDLEVIAWNDHETDGAVESVAVLPSGADDQVWLIIRRSVNGGIVRYVERMQPNWYPVYGTTVPDPNVFPPGDYPINWGFTLDCALTADDAAGKTVWTGLGHLEGKTVRCLADGVDMPPMVVTGGQVTLPRAAKRVLIGLMFKPSIVMLTPEFQGGGGSIQADALSMNEVVVRVVNTIGTTVNGTEVIPGRIIGPDQLDFAPALFTGDKPISTLGWSRGKAEITIEQDDPFPFHLLAVIRSITANAG
jgi:hypothetical protein